MNFTFGVGSSSHNLGNRPIRAIVDGSAFTARAQMAVQPMEGGGNTIGVWIWSATSSLPLMRPTGQSRAWTCTAVPMLQWLDFRLWALSFYDVFHHIFQVLHSMYFMDFLMARVERMTPTCAWGKTRCKRSHGCTAMQIRIYQPVATTRQGPGFDASNNHGGKAYPSRLVPCTWFPVQIGQFPLPWLLEGGHLSFVSTQVAKHPWHSL